MYPAMPSAADLTPFSGWPGDFFRNPKFSGPRPTKPSTQQYDKDHPYQNGSPFSDPQNTELNRWRGQEHTGSNTVSSAPQSKNPRSYT